MHSSKLQHCLLLLTKALSVVHLILFMWQDDSIGVARFIDASLERLYSPAGPPVGDQAADQP